MRPPARRRRNCRQNRGRSSIKRGGSVFGLEGEMALVDVKTEITGVIQMVICGVGDSVEEDEPVIMLESMKMQIPIAAPESGKVAEILVAEGETVTEGSVVARIEA